MAMSMSEVRAHLSEVLDRVAAGEDVEVTRHGRPAAVIVRPDKLRPARVTHLYAAADEMSSRLAAFRSRPLGRGSLSWEVAEDLISDVQASRDDR